MKNYLVFGLDCHLSCGIIQQSRFPKGFPFLKFPHYFVSLVSKHYALQFYFHISLSPLIFEKSYFLYYKETIGWVAFMYNRLISSELLGDHMSRQFVLLLVGETVSNCPRIQKNLKKFTKTKLFTENVNSLNEPSVDRVFLDDSLLNHLLKSCSVNAPDH